MGLKVLLYKVIENERTGTNGEIFYCDWYMLPG